MTIRSILMTLLMTLHALVLLAFGALFVYMGVTYPGTYTDHLIDFTFAVMSFLGTAEVVTYIYQDVAKVFIERSVQKETS